MKRKLRWGFSILLVMVILSGCGKSAKEEFIQQTKDQLTQKEGRSTFETTIKKLELMPTEETEANPMLGMLVTQLKDLSIKGTQQVDGNLVSVSMKVNAMGMSIPVEMVGSIDKTPKMYLATDMMSYFTKVIAKISGESIDDSSLDVAKYKGKYIDVMGLSEEIDKDDWQKAMEDYKKNIEEQQEALEKVMTYVNELDEKEFTKKDTVITHTFTKKEIEKIGMILAEDTKDKSEVKEALKDYKDISMKVSMDTKKNKVTVQLTIVPDQEEAENSFKSIVFEGTTQYSDKKATISLPKKEAILTKEETEELLNQFERTNDSTTTKLTDEEFNELKQTLEEVKGSLDEETKAELIASYQEFLTEEQLNEVKELLKDVGETNL